MRSFGLHLPGGLAGIEHLNPSPTAVADRRGGIPPGDPLDVDVVAPVVITTIGPDPIPVTGTDGKVHVAYARPATITKVETIADGSAGATVATHGQQETVERSIRPVTEIPAGRKAVLVPDDAYGSRTQVPAEFTQRLTATLGKALPEYQPAVSARYPNSVTQIGGTSA